MRTRLSKHEGVLAKKYQWNYEPPKWTPMVEKRMEHFMPEEIERRVQGWLGRKLTEG